MSESNKLITTTGQCQNIHPGESESCFPDLSQITYLTDGPARIEIGSDYLIVGALNRIMATQ